MRKGKGKSSKSSTRPSQMSAGGKLEEEVDGVRCHSHFQGIQSLWVQIIKRKLVASRRRFLTGRRLFSRGKLLFQRTFQQGKSLVSSRTRRWSRSRRRFLSVEKGAPVKVHVDDTVEKKVTVGASQAVMRAGDFWLDDMGYYGNVRCRKCGSCFLASIGSCGVTVGCARSTWSVVRTVRVSGPPTYMSSHVGAKG